MKQRKFENMENNWKKWLRANQRDVRMTLINYCSGKSKDTKISSFFKGPKEKGKKYDKAKKKTFDPKYLNKLA